MINHQSLRVLFLAAEADPLVKVGGLGDVAGALPRVLRGFNSTSDSTRPEGTDILSPKVDIRLVIPFHESVRQSGYSFRPVASYNVPHKSGPIAAEVYDTEIDGLPVYLVSGSPIPPGAPVYSGDNSQDGYKYAFFSLAALRLPFVLGWQPDIVHANDWHTAPAIYALKQGLAADEFYSGIKTVLNIHNLPYLGLGAGQALEGFGLMPARDSTLPGWAQDLPLPLGLTAADRIVAVSPTYAQEILTPEFGSGLADFLQTRRQAISGILNGIDIRQWDPGTDPNIPNNYSEHELALRDTNKAALTQELGLDPSTRLPLLAMITRMDNQKGVDFALEALRRLAEAHPQLPWQAILLGTGAANLEAGARKLEADYPQRVRALLRFDVKLSRRIYAGADLMLIPSRYEPCGLVQMIAMRYGCVPIGRATGGLRDTIRDSDLPKANGFLFEEAHSEALLETILRALSTYNDRRRWRRLQHYGMKSDFSWERSARQYLKLYRAIINDSD